MNIKNEIMLTEIVKEKIEERTGEDVVAQMTEVEKPQGTLRGVSVQFTGDNHAMIVYPENYADMDLSVDQMASAIADAAIRGRGQVPTLPDVEAMRQDLYLTVVNGNNREMLADIPHYLHDDLAIVARCKVAEGHGETMSFLIRNEHLPMLQMTAEEVLEVAKRNTQKNEIYSCRTMGEVMRDMALSQGMPEEMAAEVMAMAEPSLYVLTSARGTNGATAIAFSEALQVAKDRIGEDFYILPSSVHEVICVPKSFTDEPSALEEMVRDVNAGVVAPEDRLSDHVYLFDGARGDFRMFSEELMENLAEAPTDILSHGRTH